MTSMIQIFFGLADLASLVGCAWIIIRSIPSDREESRWKKILGWMGYAAVTVFFPMFWRNDTLTMGAVCLYYVVMARLLYFRGRQGIAYQIIFCVILLATELTGTFAARHVWLVMQLEGIVVYSVLVVSRVFLLLVGTLILRMIIRRRLADVQYIKIHGMVIVRYGYYWIVIYAALLLVINLYCLYFWYDVAKSGELKHSLLMMQQQRELTLQYYEELEENYNRSRKIIHDIRNHLHVIEQSSRIEDRPYIEDVHAMLNSMGMKFYTENRMLNIVLNDKLKTFSQDQVQCSLGGVGLDFISDLDITTIFANLLDNAAEEGRGNAEFWLRIRAEQIQDFILVKIENPYAECPANGRSSKPGHEGLGLQNVRQALEKYQGEMEIRKEEGIFSVTLLFAVQEE